MSEARIKALMVDVDGVPITGRPADGRHWAADLEADLGLGFENLQTAFFKPFWEEIVTGRVDLRERLTSILARLAPELTADQLITYWFRQDSRLNSRLLCELDIVREGGVRIYLATNQEHERARYLMQRLGLAPHVVGCCYSAAIGHRKPIAGFFDAVASRVELLPGELLLIDDDAENVRAAVNAGWRAVQWMAGERLCDLLGRFPTRITADGLRQNRYRDDLR
jgi:putative hydrolase of the HAD superfamily